MYRQYPLSTHLLSIYYVPGVTRDAGNALSFMAWAADRATMPLNVTKKLEFYKVLSFLIRIRVQLEPAASYLL